MKSHIDFLLKSVDLEMNNIDKETDSVFNYINSGITDYVIEKNQKIYNCESTLLQAICINEETDRSAEGLQDYEEFNHQRNNSDPIKKNNQVNQNSGDLIPIQCQKINKKYEI